MHRSPTKSLAEQFQVVTGDASCRCRGAVSEIAEAGSVDAETAVAVAVARARQRRAAMAGGIARRRAPGVRGARPPVTARDQLAAVRVGARAADGTPITRGAVPALGAGERRAAAVR